MQIAEQSQIKERGHNCRQAHVLRRTVRIRGNCGVRSFPGHEQAGFHRPEQEDQGGTVLGTPGEDG